MPNPTPVAFSGRRLQPGMAGGLSAPHGALVGNTGPALPRGLGKPGFRNAPPRPENPKPPRPRKRYKGVSEREGVLP